MKIKATVHSSEETEALGASVARELEERGIKRAFIALFGEMGVGKTAFSRGFGRYLGVSNMKSPTYTVCNEHRGRVKIHHFDFYRITDGDDLYSIGFDDIVESDGYCLGEWSENVVDFLPEDSVFVRISRVSSSDPALESVREIEVDYNGLIGE